MSTPFIPGLFNLLNGFCVTIITVSVTDLRPEEKGLEILVVEKGHS